MNKRTVTPAAGVVPPRSLYAVPANVKTVEPGNAPWHLPAVMQLEPERGPAGFAPARAWLCAAFGVAIFGAQIDRSAIIVPSVVIICSPYAPTEQPKSRG